MNNKDSPSVLEIFLSFLRLGVTAFGGPAMVAYIRELSVSKKKWLDDDSFNHGVALCQTIPGAIVVNMASYVGYRVRGIAGMLASFAAFASPAFALLLVFSVVYSKTRDMPAMVSLFNGLQVIVIAIIANAVLSFGKNTLRGWKDLFIAAASSAALLIKINPFAVISGAALTGILFYGMQMPDKAVFASGRKISLKHFKDAFLLSGCFFVSLIFLFFADKKLFDLAFVMSKIELFAFGGGYTALTLMFEEVVVSRAWLASRTFMDGVALGQVTPGPILITATFIGYLLKGLPGAAVGTLAIFLPGLMLITIILPFFDRLRSSSIFQRAIKGVISSFTGLLLSVTIKFVMDVSWDAVRVLLCAAALAAIYRKVDILYVVIAGAAISLFVL